MFMIEKLLDFFYPPMCGICGKSDKQWICENCLEKLKIDIIQRKEYNKFYEEQRYYRN